MDAYATAGRLYIDIAASLGLRCCETGAGIPEVCPGIWCLPWKGTYPLASPTVAFPPQQPPTIFELKFAEDLGETEFNFICHLEVLPQRQTRDVSWWKYTQLGRSFQDKILGLKCLNSFVGLDLPSSFTHRKK